MVIRSWKAITSPECEAAYIAAVRYLPPEIAATLDRYDHDEALYEVIVEDETGSSR